MSIQWGAFFSNDPCRQVAIPAAGFPIIHGFFGTQVPLPIGEGDQTVSDETRLGEPHYVIYWVAHQALFPAQG